MVRTKQSGPRRGLTGGTVGRPRISSSGRSGGGGGGRARLPNEAIAARRRRRARPGTCVRIRNQHAHASVWYHFGGEEVSRHMGPQNTFDLELTWKRLLFLISLECLFRNENKLQVKRH